MYIYRLLLYTLGNCPYLGSISSKTNLRAHKTSMDTSRRKEKERKERKARKERMMMAKDENHEMAKVSPTMFKLNPHHPQHKQFKINLNKRIIQQLLALDMDSSHLLMMIQFMLES